MSTEPEPTQPDPTGPESADEEPTPPPVEIDPVSNDPEPEEDTEAPPPPEQSGSLSVTVDPGTWYEVTSVCTTADTGNGTPCRNLNQSTTEPEVYSNAGTIRMVCGVCGKYRPILSVVRLDPQPEMS